MKLSQLDLDLMECSDKGPDVGGILQYGDYYYRIVRVGYHAKGGDPANCVYRYDVFILGELVGLHEGFEHPITIIGSPFGRGRVCMLRAKLNIFENDVQRPEDLEEHFIKNPELYDMDCLSWDDETKKLILDFLHSLSINK